ncbi:MAG: FtsK/SpoIIIE domain-containing protein [Isosphaeraceae bacterium]|nr:FtsK/SpoIIIE domain-containing protein [Isosphaeraceae bacterium]
MPESPLIQKEVQALRDLERLSAERATAETDTEVAFQSRKDAEAKSFREAHQRLASASKSETEATQTRYQQVRTEIARKADAERKATEAEYAEARARIEARVKSGRKSAKKEMEESKWQALALFEASKDGAVKQFKEAETDLAAAAQEFQVVQEDAAGPLAACRGFAPKDAAEVPLAAPPAEGGSEAPAAESPAAAVPENPVEEFKARVKLAEEQTAALAKLKLPKFLKPQTYIWPFLILGSAVAGGLIFGAGMSPTIGGVAGGVAAIGLGVGIWIWLAGVAKKEVSQLYPPLVRTMEEAERLLDQSKTWNKANFERKKVEVEEKRESTIREAEKKHARLNSDLQEWMQKETKAIEAKYPALLTQIQERRDQALREADEKYPRLLNEMKERFEREQQQLQDAYRQQKETTQRLHDEAWNTLAKRWQDGLTQVGNDVGEINQVAGNAFLEWHTADLDTWQMPKVAPDGMRFGQFTVDMKDIPQGIPTDPRLKAMGPTSFTMPSLLPFPAQASILIKSAEAGRSDANQLLQTAMLRILTSVPPGKARFTIVDPVGLGESFAAFMHLGDYHDLLVTDRIWTETPHIEQKLADLSAHMENVIQLYLRNEFETIEQYNVHAGEVAEPYRILVVANFPAGFSESAARRLVSIANSGARCGVFTLISMDVKQQLPSGCQLKDLEGPTVHFNWRDGKLAWREPDFGKYPLQLDVPPAQETVSKLMHVVGLKARDANRVEVPFEFIAPKPEEYWTGDTSKIVDIPLGRAGATKLQSLVLGKGTSQHGLIAGKTGSGKSTLLHALIVNGVLRYSPDQLELYLIDFKKGVEFKVYAEYKLPHARVIAVESEREFGLSVLQKLDLELKERGERFRELGVQDLRGFREVTNGKEALPRILFVVDEFQEFFTEDDKVAQDVALLLDRLVRQGRAFGIHVMLGSQTLGGAFSVSRATLGQMAVRIALQCNEADAHLILSDDNSAARLLTRPGEAIYNDANGLVEGNNVFQVVWLSDAKRVKYLERLQEMYQELHRPPVEQIVFEGNLPAIPAMNYILDRLLSAPDWPVDPKADYAWLGEAIAIKDPTCATFRPQSGSNLLVVGQNDVLALGILSMSMISLAAQRSPAGVRFYLLDGSPADSVNCGQLAEISKVLPHSVKVVSGRELASNMAEVAAEVERRQTDPTGDNALIFIIIFDLPRFRDLRKGDDDFGSFSRYGEEKAVPPSKLFGNILRDGPPVNVHTIVWCDSLNNLNRTFDRQSLKEFEMRVLFQMSANDSSSLIDAPTAGKLGSQRALYHSEEEGRAEKFRPYAIPAEDWLPSVKERFGKRAGAVAAPQEPEPASAAASSDGHANGHSADGNGSNGDAQSDFAEAAVPQAEAVEPVPRDESGRVEWVEP